MRIISVLFLVSLSAWAQARPIITGVGYVPATMALAPGEVITLFAQGLQAPDTEAGITPWPLTLAGVRVSLREPAYGYSRDLPILNIKRLPCNVGAPIPCDTQAITVQTPTDLPTSPPPFSGRGPAVPTITIYENGVEGFATRYNWVPARWTVLNDCFEFLRSSAASCSSSVTVTHADGRLVSSSDPGRAGEIIVLYGVGLGVTSPVVTEGQAAPSPAPRAVNSLRTWFSITTIPDDFPVDGSWSQPEFAGLVPGYVGLYQVNLRLPTTLPPTSANGQRPITITFDSNGQRSIVQIDALP